MQAADLASFKLVSFHLAHKSSASFSAELPLLRHPEGPKTCERATYLLVFGSSPTGVQHSYHD